MRNVSHVLIARVSLEFYEKRAAQLTVTPRGDMLNQRARRASGGTCAPLPCPARRAIHAYGGRFDAGQ